MINAVKIKSITSSPTHWSTLKYVTVYRRGVVQILPNMSLILLIIQIKGNEI